MPLVLFARLVATVVLAQSANPYFEKAQRHFDTFEYGECLRDLELARTLATQNAERARAEVLHGLCTFHLGRRQDAEARFELALRLDATVTLPDNTSPRIVALFSATQARLARERPADPPVQAAEPPRVDAPRAEPEFVPAPTPMPETPTGVAPAPVVKKRSLVPLVILGGVAVVSGGFGLGWGVNARAQEVKANQGRYEVDVAAAARDARTSALIANVSYSTAGAFAIAALLSYFLQPGEVTP